MVGAYRDELEVGEKECGVHGWVLKLIGVVIKKTAGPFFVSGGFESVLEGAVNRIQDSPDDR